MNINNSEETHSFRDPMATRLEAAQKRRDELEGQFPLVSKTYDAFYLRVDKVSKEGDGYFLGAEGIVGSELLFDREDYTLCSEDGRVLASLDNKTLERLAPHVLQKWRIKVFLSTTYFRAQDKSAAADVVFICWAPLEATYDEALTHFSHNIAHRLASGDKTSARLNQEQFIKVLESNGGWYLTSSLKPEAPLKGTVVYKSRRTSIERLTGYALKHKVGCNILAIIFWVLLAAGIVALVRFFFFS